MGKKCKSELKPLTWCDWGVVHAYNPTHLREGDRGGGQPKQG